MKHVIIALLIMTSVTKACELTKPHEHTGLISEVCAAEVYNQKELRSEMSKRIWVADCIARRLKINANEVYAR